MDQPELLPQAAAPAASPAAATAAAKAEAQGPQLATLWHTLRSRTLRRRSHPPDSLRYRASRSPTILWALLDAFFSDVVVSSSEQLQAIPRQHPNRLRIVL